MGKSTSVRFNDGQRQKLRQLAEMIGTSPNAVVGMLVDNAELATVQRLEAVPRLSAKGNRHDIDLSTEDVTAVRA